MIRRGDVVLVHLRFVIGTGGKLRPAVVVQSDRNNARLQSTVVVGVTGNTMRIGLEPTQLLIDPATPDGRSSGLLRASAVKCENLFNIPQADVRRTLGHLSDPLLLQLGQCLKAAFDLP